MTKTIIRYVVAILMAFLMSVAAGFTLQIFNPGYTTADLALALATTALVWIIISDSENKDLHNKENEL